MTVTKPLATPLNELRASLGVVEKYMLELKSLLKAYLRKKLKN